MRFLAIVLFIISCSTANEGELAEDVTKESFRNAVVDELNREDSLNKGSKESKNENCHLIYSESTPEDIAFSQAIDTTFLDSLFLVFYEVEGIDLPLSKRDYYIEQMNCLNSKGKNQFFTSVDSTIVVTDEFLAFKTLSGYDSITFIQSDRESAVVAFYLDHLKIPDLNLIGIYGYEGRVFRLIDKNGWYMDIQGKPVFNRDWTMFVDAGTLYDLSEARIDIYNKNQNKFVKKVSLDIASSFEDYWIPRFPVWLNDSSLLIYRESHRRNNDRYLGMRIFWSD